MNYQKPPAAPGAHGETPAVCKKAGASAAARGRWARMGTLNGDALMANSNTKLNVKCPQTSPRGHLNGTLNGCMGYLNGPISVHT